MTKEMMTILNLLKTFNELMGKTYKVRKVSSENSYCIWVMIDINTSSK
jgi:hypothetical protein